MLPLDSYWGASSLGLIGAARDRGEVDLGNAYYHYWLRAVEFLIIHNGYETDFSIDARLQTWRNAYRATRLGWPVELAAGLDFLSISPE